MITDDLLILRGVYKNFSEKKVLEPLDLQIAKGTFLALLGPSGCGKTTLLRMIAGLEDPTGGEIWLGNQLLFGNGVSVPPEKRHFGMVFQSYAVWPHMTVFENVAYPLRIQKKESIKLKKAVFDALALVHLEDLSGRYPHQLSGGQQQRVALARGLAMQPQLLLLDEPLSNLDAKLRSEMRQEIREIHRKLRFSTIYVTHDQREAFEMATEIALVNEGKIAQRGTPDEIRRSPAPGFVTEFLAWH